VKDVADKLPFSATLENRKCRKKWERGVGGVKERGNILASRERGLFEDRKAPVRKDSKETKPMEKISRKRGDGRELPCR